MTTKRDDKKAANTSRERPAKAGNPKALGEDLDEDLNEALKETFPASDAPAIGQSSAKPDRPEHRQTPVIDLENVRRLARKVK